ncbi:hypothetical protein DID99_35835 [Burkholderia sp. Bp8986]|nr:hypothetical protein DID99_35835 [Burkholderia sp. Bp8986]
MNLSGARFEGCIFNDVNLDRALLHKLSVKMK